MAGVGVTAGLCRFLSPLELHSRHTHCNGLGQAGLQQVTSHQHQAACRQYDTNYPDHKRR